MSEQADQPPTIETIATHRGEFRVIDESGKIFKAKWEHKPSIPTKRPPGVHGWASCNFCDSKGWTSGLRLHVCAATPCLAKHPASKYGGRLSPPNHVRLLDAPAVAGSAPASAVAESTTQSPAPASTAPPASAVAELAPPAAAPPPEAAAPPPPPVAAPLAPPVADLAAVAPAPPPAVTSSFAEVVAPPERAALSFIPCAAPRPPEAAAAVAPAKVPPLKPPAVAGSDVHVRNVADVDPVDNLVAASGLYNHRVAAELNTFALAMEEPRGYIGIAMFVIFALRYRVRVFLWFGDTCEDALLQYAPWANDAVSAVAKCHAVSCKFRDDGSVRGLDDEAFRTNHWVAGFPLDGGGAPGGASLADSMCEETRFLYAQYLSHSVQLAATVTDGDCGVDVMCSMLGWNRSSVNRDALRSELCAYILKHAGNRALVAMLRHTGEIDNHLGLYELDVAGAALVAARPPEHRHGDGGAQGALCEGPKHAERHYSEEEVLALRRKCGLRTAGREMVVRMLKRLPDECVKALVREYTTRGDGEEKTQTQAAPTFLLVRDASLFKKRRAAEYFLAWMEEHQGPLHEKTTRALQRGRFPRGLFKAFATEHPAVGRATEAGNKKPFGQQKKALCGVQKHIEDVPERSEAVPHIRGGGARCRLYGCPEEEGGPGRVAVQKRDRPYRSGPRTT